jgi:nickel-type superoxide dismutase maturation protease
MTGTSTSWDGLLPYARVVVTGDSMSPTLHDGDQLLCRRVHPGMGVREGDVVVLERPDRPGLILVKRVVRRTPLGWWVEGDNAAASDDSRVFGSVGDEYVVARVLRRIWPRPRRV